MYVEKLTITFRGSKDQESSERTSRRCAATKNALEKSHLLRTVRIRRCKHSLYFLIPIASPRRVVSSNIERGKDGDKYVAALCVVHHHFGASPRPRARVYLLNPYTVSFVRRNIGARSSPTLAPVSPSKSHCLIGRNNSRGAFCSLTRTAVCGRRHITDAAFRAANSGRGKYAGKSMNYATSRAATTVIYRQSDRAGYSENI